jgi:hypothetical protein
MGLISGSLTDTTAAWALRSSHARRYPVADFPSGAVLPLSRSSQKLSENHPRNHSAKLLPSSRRFCLNISLNQLPPMGNHCVEISLRATSGSVLRSPSSRAGPILAYHAVLHPRAASARGLSPARPDGLDAENTPSASR